MNHVPLIAPTADRLDEYARYILGSSGSTRGKPIEKYLVPKLCMAAAGAGLDGAPRIILPVWISVLSERPTGATVEVKRPFDGLIAVWDKAPQVFLVLDEGRSTSVALLPTGESAAHAIEMQKGKGFFGTTVPGMYAGHGAAHVAVGLRNAISVDVDRSRQHFASLCELLDPTSGPTATTRAEVQG